MAGITTFTVLIGGTDADPSTLDTLLDRHDLDADDGQPLAGPGVWRHLEFVDIDSDTFEGDVQPLLNAAKELGLYWRVAQRGRDDFDECWFDVHGREVSYDPFADLRDGGHRAGTRPLHVTADEVAHLAACVDYRGHNLIARDAEVAADEADVNDRVAALLQVRLAGRA